MDCPWSKQKTLETTNKKERLHLEILEFQEYISPTNNETIKREELLNTVKEVVKRAFPMAQMEIFGSLATGLLLPGSDIDVSLNFSSSTNNNKKLLRNLYDVLGRDKTFKRNELQPIYRAKVPVLIIDSTRYITSMDISFNNIPESCNRTIIWIEQHPELFPLYMVLKHSLLSLSHPLKNFQVMSSKWNGLASYSLICLIVHYLKYQKKDTVKSSSPTYYADLLIGFLDFYSKFDYLHKGFQFVKDEPYFNKENGKPYLYIKDLDVHGANVGRSTNKIKETIQCISFLLNNLLKNINDTSIINSSVLSTIIKIKTETNQRPEGRNYKIDPVPIDRESLRLIQYQHNIDDDENNTESTTNLRTERLEKRTELKEERTILLEQRQKRKREIEEETNRKRRHKKNTEKKSEDKEGRDKRSRKEKKGNERKKKKDGDHSKSKKKRPRNNSNENTDIKIYY